MNETVKNDETGEDDKAEATEASEFKNLSQFELSQVIGFSMWAVLMLNMSRQCKQFIQCTEKQESMLQSLLS